MSALLVAFIIVAICLWVDAKQRRKAFIEGERRLEAYDKACKEYRRTPGCEGRFDTQEEHDEYYQQIWDNHGGTKLVGS